MRTAILTGVLAAAFCGQASAAVITETFTVAATAFSGTPTPPFAAAALNVSVTFDPTLTYTDATTLTVNSITPAYLAAVTPGFTYSPTTANGELSIGGLLNNAASAVSGTNDYFTAFDNVKATPTYVDFVYTQAGYTGAGVSSTGTVVATPEPASLAILAAAVPALLSRRGPRRKVV